MTGLVVALYPALVSGVLAWGTMTEPVYLLWVGLRHLPALSRAGRSAGRGRGSLRCWASFWGWPI